jgi:hypothetical protein
VNTRNNCNNQGSSTNIQANLEFE